MRVVVAGGREFLDAELMNEVMDQLTKEWGITEIAHGGQKAYMPLTKRWRGCDYHAGEWAAAREMPCTPFPVSDEEWRRLHKAAGPVRNRRMINEFAPDRVIAFPGNKGTKDCVTWALSCGIEVFAVDRDAAGHLEIHALSDPRLL